MPLNLGDGEVFQSQFTSFVLDYFDNKLFGVEMKFVILHSNERI